MFFFFIINKHFRTINDHIANFIPVRNCFLLKSFSPKVIGVFKMSYKYLKKTTGLTRLNVAKNPHYTLGVLYGKILRTLQKMPEDASYRKYTEEIVSQRARIVQQSETVEDIENKINCGQAEELIVQAENELVLTRKMLAFKPWESIITRPNADQWLWPPGK